MDCKLKAVSKYNILENKRKYQKKEVGSCSTTMMSLGKVRLQRPINHCCYVTICTFKKRKGRKKGKREKFVIGEEVGRFSTRLLNN